MNRLDSKWNPDKSKYCCERCEKSVNNRYELSSHFGSDSLLCRKCIRSIVGEDNQQNKCFDCGRKVSDDDEEKGIWLLYYGKYDTIWQTCTVCAEMNKNG
jgi:hypothetical protein